MRRCVALLLLAMLAGAAAPTAEASNGCGPRDWRERVAPEAPLGFDFHGSCVRHDRCYATSWSRVSHSYWSAKRRCDLRFYADMARACGGSRLCRRVAYLYFRAVALHGHRSFRRAQRRARRRSTRSRARSSRATRPLWRARSQ